MLILSQHMPGSGLWLLDTLRERSAQHSHLSAADDVRTNLATTAERRQKRRAL